MKTSTFALILGIASLLAGLMGLVPLFLVPPPMGAPPTHFTLLYGYLLGMFPVNLLASMFHIVIGAWGISAWSGRSNPIRFCRDAAILFGALAVMGMFPSLNTVFGMMPIHGNDVWLNALTTLAAAYFGWREPLAAKDRRHILGDRRQRLMPISRERRFGLADRREGFGSMAPGF
jgi:hypothetical protein